MHDNRAFIIEGEENYKKFLEAAEDHTVDKTLERFSRYHKKDNCKKLEVSYEIFVEENITVLSVIDPEKDEVLNMFYDNEATELYERLIKVKSNIEELEQ